MKVFAIRYADGMYRGKQRYHRAAALGSAQLYTRIGDAKASPSFRHAKPGEVTIVEFELKEVPEPTPGLAPHEQRVVAEFAELTDRITKLGAFIATPAFHGLDDTDRALLEEQLGAMGEYAAALDYRIRRFKGAT